MHAQKGASEAPRTRFRACKTSKFSGGVPPDPPCTIYIMGPLFAFALGPSDPLSGPAQNSSFTLFIAVSSVLACHPRAWGTYVGVNLAMALIETGLTRPATMP